MPIQSGLQAADPYVCPFCGNQISKEDVLFFETVRERYSDDIRADWLYSHGMRVPAGKKYPRIYYHVRPDSNAARMDENGFPVMIEVSPDHAIRSENPDRYEDDSFFDSDAFEAGPPKQPETAVRRIPMRACPHCHCELPMRWGTIPVHHVAVFGSRRAGVLPFLICWFRQLRDQLAENDLGRLYLERESASFLEPMAEDYERGEDWGRHLQRTGGGLMPIVCLYRNREYEALIVFHYLDPEGLLHPAEWSGCESLLFLVDPFVLAGKRNEIPRTPDDAPRYCGSDDDSDPAIFFREAGAFCHQYVPNVRHVICVMTGLDLLLAEEFGENAPGMDELLKDIGAGHRGAVSLPVLRRVEEELSSCLQHCFRLDLRQMLLDTFGTEADIGILGISVAPADLDQSGIRGAANPSAEHRERRIIEPFLLLLVQNGLVQVQDDDEPVKEQKDEKPGFRHWLKHVFDPAQNRSGKA